MGDGVTLADLRSIDLFEDLGDAELQPWLDVIGCRIVAAGDLLAEQGAPAPGLQLLLYGSARTFLVDGERPEPVGRQEAPTWIGAIAVLTDGLMGVRMVAETECRLALVQPEEFTRLVLSQPPVHARVMRQIAPVVRRLNDIEQNRERLASLGTMAAGLARELNNPAAAAQRAAALHVINGAMRGFVESWSRSATTVPACRPRCRGGSSNRSSRRRTSARARVSVWRPPGGSSPTVNDGSLTLQSQPGRKTFRVRLPFTQR